MNEFSITIGRYVRGNSYLYKIDPRTKIIGTIILMAAIFLIPANSLNSLYVLLGIFGALLLVIITSRINFLSFLKGLQPILLISLFTFFLQLIYNKDGTIINNLEINWSVLSILAITLLLVLYFMTSKFIKLKFIYFVIIFILGIYLLTIINVGTFKTSQFVISSLGLIKGAFYCLRIVLAVMVSTILTMSTSPNDINLGLEWVLYPLSLIKIPVSTFSMMLSLTLRFIPTLAIETNKIMKAQASRGIDFNEGNILQKVKQITTLLVPMFALSITKAEDLANAMEVRGYVVGAKRTSINELKFRLLDLFSGLFVLALLAVSILARIYLWELN